MAISVKCFCIMSLLVAIYGFDSAYADGKCSDPYKDAVKLVPCMEATKDEKAKVKDDCCKSVKELVLKPDCLCGLLLSDLAKSSGVNISIALTIPKRCSIANRPVGYKCGDYRLP